MVRIVATRTSHPPQLRCGMKSSTSTRKARSDINTVGMVKRNSARRNLGEWAGEWK
jgi:hypothetical protein